MLAYYETLLDNPQQLMLWGVFILGLCLGAILQWSQLCLLRALIHAKQGKLLKLKAFALAMATALLSTQLVAWLHQINLAESHYAQSSPALPLIFLGGLLFGTGMALANACTGRNLVLLASGNLRSLVTLLCVALGAGIAMSGLLATTRVALENLTRVELPVNQLPMLIGLLAALALIAYALFGTTLWRSPRDLFGAILIGLLVAFGWYLTGVVGYDEFEPVRLASITFIAPILETQQYMLLSTGSRLSLGIVLVIGVFLGAFLRALFSREFHWQTFESTQQMKRSLVGGLFMGIGGVLALGCSYGQLLSGFSTLAIASLVAIFGILLGGWLTIKLTHQ